MEQFFIQNGDIIIRLIVAVVLGLLIGAERLLVKEAAGMKTHALVSLGAAVFIIISEMVAMPVEIIIGFLTLAAYFKNSVSTISKDAIL